jgi:hypothetical protein
MSMMLSTQAHDQISELMELCTNQRLGHVISDHIINMTLINHHFITVNQVVYIKPLDIEVLSSLAGTGFAIFLQLHGTSIILTYDVYPHDKLFPVQESFCP